MFLFILFNVLWLFLWFHWKYTVCLFIAISFSAKFDWDVAYLQNFGKKQELTNSLKHSYFRLICICFQFNPVNINSNVVSFGFRTIFFFPVLIFYCFSLWPSYHNKSCSPSKPNGRLNRCAWLRVTLQLRRVRFTINFFFGSQWLCGLIWIFSESTGIHHWLSNTDGVNEPSPIDRFTFALQLTSTGK